MMAHYRMVEDLHAQASDGRVVTVQVWRTFGAKRKTSRFYMFIDGAARVDEEYVGAARHVLLDAELAKVRRVYAERPPLDHVQAWAVIERNTGERRPECPALDCGVPLPVGGVRCSECMRSPRRVAWGAMSGARRRGLILLSVPTEPAS